MTIQYHFVCATPACRTHVHVTILCHDEQAIDHDKIGEAVGFRERKDQPFIGNHWHCAEHAA